MKLVIFQRNKSDVKWDLFFETIKLNIEKGNAVFIGNKEHVKELEEELSEEDLE